MIWIIEGPDGAGKTYLARELVKRLDAFYMHDRYTPKQWQLNSGQLRMAVKKFLAGQHVILDRHWLGDNLYASVFRHGQAGAWVRRIDSVMHRFGTTYILCLPPIDQLEEEFQELRKQRPEKFNSVREVACRYHDLYHGNVMRPSDGDYMEQQSAMYPWKFATRNVFVYDRFKVPQTQVWRWFKNHVFEHAVENFSRFHEADPLDHSLDAWELSGSLATCKALLVGERAMHLEAAANWPFYSDRQSAAYLTKALHRMKACETHVAITNAYSVKGNSTDNCMRVIRWLKVNRPEVRIIAMGKEAEKTVKYHGYRLDAGVPHPQWARRFDHNGDWWRQLEVAIYGGADGSGRADILE